MTVLGLMRRSPPPLKNPFQIYRPPLVTEISPEGGTAHNKNHWFNSYGSTTVEVNSKFLHEFVFGFTLSYETNDGSYITAPCSLLPTLR